MDAGGSALVASMRLRRRRGRLDGGESLQDAGAVVRPGRHEPGIAGFEPDGLAFQNQLGAPGDHVADGLVVAPRARLAVLGRLVPPETHRDPLAGRKVNLTHRARRRVCARYLLDRRVRHRRLLRAVPFQREEPEAVPAGPLSSWTPPGASGPQKSLASPFTSQSS